MNLVDSYQEISKPKELCSRLSYPSKRYVRSNGSNVIVQQMYDKPVEVNGHNVMQYHVLETLNEYGKTVVRKNTIYTTSNLFKINDEFVINRLLDRGRLNEKSMEGNPYVGAISNNGTILEREDLNSFFRTDTNKKINKIPTFDEMKNNITKYELFTDSDNFAPEDTSKYKIRDKETGALREIGDIFKETLSHAVNDDFKDYPGDSDAEKKANVLKQLCKDYDKVVFVDDDTKNVRAARGLQINNLKVIKAWDN